MDALPLVNTLCYRGCIVMPNGRGNSTAHSRLKGKVMGFATTDNIYSVGIVTDENCVVITRYLDIVVRICRTIYIYEFIHTSWYTSDILHCNANLEHICVNM